MELRWNAATIDVEFPDRLPKLERGAHHEGSSGMCAMEAAAWLSGEPWSDHPRSVHRVIAAVARAANDQLDDAARQRCWPLVLAAIGTARRFDPRLSWQLRRVVRQHAMFSGEYTLWAALISCYEEATGRRFALALSAAATSGTSASPQARDEPVPPSFRTMQAGPCDHATEEPGR